MRPTAIRCACVTLLALAFAAPASAQNTSLVPPARPDREWRLMPRWDTYVWSAGTSVGTAPFTSETRTTAWVNALSAQLDLGFVVGRISIPLAWAEVATRTTDLTGTRTSSNDQAELGNITLEGLADIDLGHPDHRLLIGGGLALPTATDQLTNDDIPSTPAMLNVRGTLVRGLAWATSFRNAAQWAGNSFTVWPSVEYRYTHPWVLVIASVALPIFFPTNSDFGGPLLRGNVEMMFSTDISAAVRLLDTLDLGASFLAWALPSGAGDDRDPDLGQTALTLFVRTDEAIDSPVGGGFEMIFNLDEDWGPTGDDGRFWGAHIFLTAQIDR